MSAWANRRAAVQAEADAIERAKHEATVATQQAALAEKPDDEVLATLELPNPDEMQAGDDFSAFMKENVPSALRNRALKKLWTSDPVLANVDMLVDYGDDFTGKNDPIGLIKTIYRVGKGMLPDDEELPEIAPLAEDEDDPKDKVEVNAQAEEIVLEAPVVEAATAFAPRRRMRFDFEAGEPPASAEMEKV